MWINRDADNHIVGFNHGPTSVAHAGAGGEDAGQLDDEAVPQRGGRAGYTAPRPHSRTLPDRSPARAADRRRRGACRTGTACRRRIGCEPARMTVRSDAKTWGQHASRRLPHRTISAQDGRNRPAHGSSPSGVSAPGVSDKEGPGFESWIAHPALCRHFVPSLGQSPNAPQPPKLIANRLADIARFGHCLKATAARNAVPRRRSRRTSHATRNPIFNLLTEQEAQARRFSRAQQSSGAAAAGRSCS
jgi:hypothetical protein